MKENELKGLTVVTLGIVCIFAMLTGHDSAIVGTIGGFIGGLLIGKKT